MLFRSLREKVGVVYGNPEVTTGGRALKVYASVRIEVRRSEHIKNGTELLGSRTRCKVVKNKVSPPFREAMFDIMYGEGISLTGELVDLGVDYNLVQKSGAWFNMGDIRLGQGRDNAKLYFKEHPEEATALQAKLMEAMQEETKNGITRAKPAKKSKKGANDDDSAEESAEESVEEAPKPAKAVSRAVSVDADDFEDDLVD